MEADFWHEKWDAQQIGFHQQAVNPLLIEYWAALGLPGDTKIFVPLCGKSLDMCYLAEQGHDVVGCELNQAAVSQFYLENSLEHTVTETGSHRQFSTEQISIYQGDIFALPPSRLKNIAGFYDRAALIAWPEAMRLAYVDKLAALIPPGSPGLLITLDYPQQALKGPPFAVSCDWLAQNVSAHFDIELLGSQDVLEDNPRFINRGVPWLTESVYRLIRRG